MRGHEMLKWDATLISLLQHSPAVYCAVINRHAEPQASNYLLQRGYQNIQGLPFTCFSSSGSEHFPPSPQTRDKLLYYYAMDMASLSPVLALDPQAGDTVLDMCAAPGGKAFAILQLVRSQAGGAVALNDCSVSRVKRLNDVVRMCVAKGINHSVRITKRRGEDWSKIEEGMYDRVLVDAPCSADRHNIAKWTKRNLFWPDTVQFRKLQQSLLFSALHAVRSRGTVVYSTCTLSTQENDVVVHEAIECARKRGCQVEAVAPLEQELGETLFGEVEGTEFGKLIVPSTSTNIGPMYLSKLYVTSIEE